MKKVFILGGADAEMETIRQLLVMAGVAHTAPLKGWGEKPDLNLIEGYYNGHEADLIFVECGPPEDFKLKHRIVDHHGDHSNRKSSVYQVLDILKDSLPSLSTQLIRWVELVSANDVGYIPAMLAIGATQEEVNRVRALERKMQGITTKHENEANSSLCDIHYNKAAANKLVQVSCPHSKSSPVTDRLFPHWSNGEKLLIASPEEINFFGDGRLCAELEKDFGGWSGGSGRGISGGQGFYGTSDRNVFESVTSTVVSFYD